MQLGEHKSLALNTQLLVVAATAFVLVFGDILVNWKHWHAGLFWGPWEHAGEILLGSWETFTGGNIMSDQSCWNAWANLPWVDWVDETERGALGSWQRFIELWRSRISTSMLKSLGLGFLLRVRKNPTETDLCLQNLKSKRNALFLFHICEYCQHK